MSKNLNSPHGSAQLFVRHLGILLAFAPHFGHLVRLHELEHAVLAPFPPDEARVRPFAQQQIPDELPQFPVHFVCSAR